MSTEIRPVHSPLGASGAERWMQCPGSAALLKELKLPPSDEPEYRSLGTSAHAVGHHCLVNHLDAWEAIGNKFEKHDCDAGMAEAVQVYLDEVRSLVTPEAKVYFEFGVDAPDFNKDFYGTLDCGVVVGNKMFIRDYKHGEGIAVDVEDNPQVKYYGYGLLRHHPEVEEVEFGIVQPRAFHPDGRVRRWSCSAAALKEWAETELIGAMHRTEMDGADLNAGAWCRFCPAKLVCPLMTSLFGAAMQADPKTTVNLSDESLGRSYQYTAAVKQYLRAMEEEAFRRLNIGGSIPGIKLVNKKAHRVFKSEALEIFQNAFGADALTKPELKSPSQMEELGTAAKKLVKEYAYSPNTGLTVALDSDKRGAVKVQNAAETFQNALEVAAQ